MRDTFTYNGRSSDEFGIIVDNPTIVMPNRKYTAYAVSGRNGNVYDVTDGWNEIVVQYKILAGIQMRESAYVNFARIAEWLNSATDYVKLEDTFDPTHYRDAICLDGYSVVTGLKKFGKTTISFRCKPERFLKTAIKAVDFSNTIILYNPTGRIAKPLIYLDVPTSDNSSLQINDRILSIGDSWDEEIIIDCENELIIDQETATGYYFNAYSAVMQGANPSAKYLYFDAGENTIVGSNLSTGRIDPRFWEL